MTAKLAYSLCWEDPELDAQALNLGPGRRGVIITSAGCNALSLLDTDPDELTCVDVNPAQTALMDLRIAALSALGREAYLAFVGEAGSQDRARVYSASLAPRLRRTASRQYWSRHLGWIRDGVHRAGALERHFGVWRFLMRLVQGRRRIESLFEPRDREGRVRFYEDEWDRPAYRSLVRVFFNRTALSAFAKRKEHFRHVTVDDIAGNFLDKCRRTMTDLPLESNYFLAQIFLGRYRTLCDVPPYLAPDTLYRVRDRLDRLKLVTADLATALRSLPRSGIHAFYLSNICEWLEDEQVDTIFQAMTDAAAPGARATSRCLLANRPTPPERFINQWRPLPEIARTLHRQDRSFLYSSFHVLERTAS